MNTRTKAKNSRLVGLALTTALATTALSGCASHSAPTANYSAAQAEVALKEGKVGQAVEHAEAAVLASPRDAYARTLLGNAYLESGRFQSAATTFGEAVTLGDTAPRTIISLALAQIGAGDTDAAYATLTQYQASIDPADFGLAIALAGHADQGARILTEALQNGANTPKVRQNLAYAFALAGDWRSARLMAAEDVPADQVGDRMAEWAALVGAPHSAYRVASLLDVRPVADSGQPTRLALANFPAGDVQLAAAVPADATPVAAFAMASELPVVAAASNPVADSGDAALADAGLAVAEPEGPRFVSREVAQPIPAAAAPAKAATFRQAFAPVVRPAPVPSLEHVDIARGNHAVQLGAFASMSNAQEAWKEFQRRYPELAGAEKIITKARVGGKIYYRVAAAGFARASALEMCSMVKGKGGGCIAYAKSRPLPGAIAGGETRVAAR